MLAIFYIILATATVGVFADGMSAASSGETAGYGTMTRYGTTRDSNRIAIIDIIGVVAMGTFGIIVIGTFIAAVVLKISILFC